MTTAVTATALVVAACTDDGADGTSASLPPSPCTSAVGTCSLAEAGRAIDVRIGVALSSSQLADPMIAALVRQEFTQITAENELKWSEVERTEGVFDFAGADALVDFAVANGLETRGHTLLWGQRQGNGMPPWVREITDPARLEAVLQRWIQAAVGRYRGRVQRWDVVNEPLAIAGPGLDQNPFLAVLGERYVDRAFAEAAAADPDAELWLNEVGAETNRERADALVELVTRLRARGVPVHGVGLQGHFVNGEVPAVGQLRALVERLRGLGVEVALTELDVAVRTDVADPLQVQAEAFRQITAECLEGGCAELSFWGIGDAFSWLDTMLRRPADPLLFDRSLQPKPAYEAVRNVVAQG